MCSWWARTEEHILSVLYTSNKSSYLPTYAWPAHRHRLNIFEERCQQRMPCKRGPEQFTLTHALLWVSPAHLVKVSESVLFPSIQVHGFPSHTSDIYIYRVHTIMITLSTHKRFHHSLRVSTCWSAVTLNYIFRKHLNFSELDYFT